MNRFKDLTPPRTRGRSSVHDGFLPHELPAHLPHHHLHDEEMWLRGMPPPPPPTPPPLSERFAPMGAMPYPRHHSHHSSHRSPPRHTAVEVLDTTNIELLGEHPQHLHRTQQRRSPLRPWGAARQPQPVESPVFGDRAGVGVTAPNAYSSNSNKLMNFALRSVSGLV